MFCIDCLHEPTEYYNVQYNNVSTCSLYSCDITNKNDKISNARICGSIYILHVRYGYTHKNIKNIRTKQRKAPHK